MIAGGVGFAFAPGADHVAGAVLVRAEEGPAPVDALLFRRFGGIIRGGRSGRIFGDAARQLEPRIGVRAIPVTHPLPGIAGFIVEAVTVGGELRDGRQPRESVLALVLDGEAALPGIGHELAPGIELIPPGIHAAGETAAGGEFPLGLGGQALSSPLGVGHGIRIGDLDDGVVVLPFDIALRPFRMAPVGPFFVSPPLEIILQGDGIGRGGKDGGAGDEILRRRGRELFLGRRDLGDSLVTRRRHKRRKLGIGHFSFIHPEGVHRHADDGPGIGHGVLASAAEAGGVLTAHGEFPAGNPSHTFRSGAGSGRFVCHRRQKGRFFVLGADSRGN